MYKSCRYCSVNFKCFNSKRIFCSRACFGKYRTNPTTLISRCKKCYKVFPVCPSELKRKGGVFCSVECCLEFKKRVIVFKSCEACGKNFKLRKKNDRFCNRVCYTAGRHLCARKGAPIDELFKAKVDIDFNEIDCFLWRGAKDKNGYGLLKADKKMHRAHRISYNLYKGEIPENFVVMHKCDNPPCVNPYHLSVGTINDNNQDMKEKGRYNCFGSKIKQK